MIIGNGLIAITKFVAATLTGSYAGGTSNNPNGVVRRTYDDGPASPWSQLRDRTRDAANNAVKQC